VSQDANVIQSVVLTGREPSCHNDTNGSIQVDSVIGGTQPYRYYFEDMEIQSDKIESLAPGVYEILVKDDNGCTYQQSITIQNPPPISIEAGPDLVLEWGDPVEVTPVISILAPEIAQVQWLFGNTIICSACLENSLVDVPITNGVYYVLLESTQGCLASDSMRVTLRRTRRVFIPSAFTPDRDGINDRFTVYGGKDVVNIKRLQVFDRWGNQMYLGENLPPNDQQYGWEGSFKEMPLDPAVFIFSAEVEFDDGEVFQWQGELTLLR
jgi:gliding motility-associated-like protein